MSVGVEVYKCENEKKSVCVWSLKEVSLIDRSIQSSNRSMSAGQSMVGNEKKVVIFGSAPLI